MFINLTNHPSKDWSAEQLKAAQCYGDIVDIEFPSINENATEKDINRKADEYLDTILKKGDADELTVHIMGEQTFCYALISKLQKEGIRCIASCTKRDAFVNEERQSVSTFHFSTFREYVPPRALRWWVKTKKKIKSFLCEPFKRKSFYSWMVLLFVLLCEIFSIVFRQTECLFAFLLASVFAIMVFILYFISRSVGLRFSIRSAIVSKLLANAIAPTTLGTLYLLVFVIHIGWLTNVILGLYTENGINFWYVFGATCLFILGLIAVIVFFPSGKDSKSDNPQKVFISGISAINFNFHNLTPLIRILQLTDNNDTECEFFILYSNYYSDSKNQPVILSNYDQYYNEALEEYKKTHAECEITEPKEIKEKLRVLIKMVAINMFPEKTWIQQGLKITFSEKETDYDRFESCYSVLDKYVKEKDNENNVLYFNLTPGTGIVGSLMTLMAIDGDRSLYYYCQRGNLSDDQRLKEVDKSQIPLRNLLSQALETIEDK